MGVPKFFRWISARYPCINAVVSEQEVPNVDHFYLDMNGILHTCSHPDGTASNFPEETIFFNIKNYIQFLVQLIKPRKTLFLAVDGVAPRAKMTQQRARRFQSALEAREAREKANRSGDTTESQTFDPCLISPGTAFMERLHTYLKSFVKEQVCHNDTWRHIDVVYSGHDCPGEGEHKIREYMSYRRTQPGYQPSDCHCIYGMDADLIFLGLTTHEMNICILRENIVKARTCIADQTPFCITYLSLLREYIDCEFRTLKDSLNFPYTLERIIDDWVFMAFLLGNDFIPHLPNLHIHAESLPVLWDTYHVVLPRLDGYLVEYGRLNLGRFHQYLEELSKFEQSWFEEREADYRWMRGKQGARLARELKTLGQATKSPKQPCQKDKDPNLLNHALPQPTALTNLFAPDLDLLFGEECLDERAELAAEGIVLPTNPWEQTKDGMIEATPPNCEADAEEDPSSDEDQLVYRMHRRDYYWSKLNIPSSSEEELKSLLLPLVTDYVRMLQWILCYYFLKVPDWDFFYAYHYAPFATDLRLFTAQFVDTPSSDADNDMAWARFAKHSAPVLPFVQQLMILPADGAYMVPECYQSLMTSPDSPLAPFFPEKFATDINGKIASWEAVVLIPFIDDMVLRTALASVQKRFTPEEAARNKHKVHFRYPAASYGSIHAIDPVPTQYVHAFFRDRVMHKMADLEKFYTRRGRQINPWFPTLDGVKFTLELSRIPVHIFEAPSRLESLSLVIDRPLHDSASLDELAHHLLGRPIRVRWPHCSVVMPVRMMTTTNVWELNDYNYQPEQPTSKRSKKHSFPISKWSLPDESTEIAWFKNCSTSLERNLRIRRAISFRENDSAKQSSILIISRQLEGWSLHCKLSKGNAETFAMVPSFKPSRASSGGDLHLTLEDPGCGWFDVPPPRRRTRASRIALPSLRIEPAYKLCDGLAVDLLDLALLGSLPPLQSGHIRAGLDAGKLVPLEKLFHPGLVVFMMAAPYLGHAGEVTGVSESKNQILVRPYPNFTRKLNLVELKRKLDKWGDGCYLTTAALASLVDIHPAIVARLTGTVLVDPTLQPNSPPAETCAETHQRRKDKIEQKPLVNIGLNLKRNKARCQVLGWSRFCSERSTWLFSKRAADLLLNLRQDFNHIWHTLTKRLTETFDSGSPALQLPFSSEVVHEIVAFIEKSGCRSAPLVPASGVYLDIALVKDLLTMIESQNSALSDAQTSSASQSFDRNSWNQTASIRCSPDTLFVPLNAAHSLNPELKTRTVSTSTGHPERLQLLDRVAFCKLDQAIPLGLFGTVIGISSDSPSYTVEVMFDREFPGAVEFRGSGPRCALVNPAMLIRIPSSADRPQPDTHPSTSTIKVKQRFTCTTSKSDHSHVKTASVATDESDSRKDCTSRPAYPKEIRVLNSLLSSFRLQSNETPSSSCKQDGSDHESHKQTVNASSRRILSPLGSQGPPPASWAKDAPKRLDTEHPAWKNSCLLPAPKRRNQHPPRYNKSFSHPGRSHPQLCDSFPRRTVNSSALPGTVTTEGSSPLEYLIPPPPPISWASDVFKEVDTEPTSSRTPAHALPTTDTRRHYTNSVPHAAYPSEYTIAVQSSFSGPVPPAHWHGYSHQPQMYTAHSNTPSAVPTVPQFFVPPTHSFQISNYEMDGMAVPWPAPTLPLGPDPPLLQDFYRDYHNDTLLSYQNQICHSPAAIPRANSSHQISQSTVSQSQGESNILMPPQVARNLPP